MDIITANSNPRIKRLNKLNKDTSYRKRENVFIVEGIRMFRELPVEKVREIYVSQSAYDKYKEELFGLSLNLKGTDGEKVNNDVNVPNINISILSDSVFETVSRTKTPQGLMSVVERFDYEFDEILNTSAKNNQLFLILESIQDPGNLGTILRTAEATGVTGIIIGGETCDIYNPKVIRSTMGAIFRVPFIYVENLLTTIDKLKENGVTTYAAHLKGNNLYNESFDDKVAFLIGNEGNGLSDEISKKADKLIKIPMKGKVESLNAAVSTSILCYEVYRQNIFNRQN